MDTKEWILSNGCIMPKGSNRRYQGREIVEDKVNHSPTTKEPRLYTVINNYNGNVRRRGKWDSNRVIENYPNAKSFEHRIKSTGELYKALPIIR